jgi:RimJ/RimL family protein N-acetyltransferase
MPEITIHGEFVDLLPLRSEHADLTFHWRQSARAALLNQGTVDAAQQAIWIASRPLSEYNFIICLKDGMRVGMVSLLDIDMTHRRAEPGRFLIGEEAAVHGIPVAVEAMKLIYDLAFNQLKLIRVYGTIASENLLIMKWQKFLGMKEEGRQRSHYFINGRIQDAVLFGMLEDEFRACALPRMNALIAAGRMSTKNQLQKKEPQ